MKKSLSLCTQKKKKLSIKGKKFLKRPTTPPCGWYQYDPQKFLHSSRGVRSEFFLEATTFFYILFFAYCKGAFFYYNFVVPCTGYNQLCLKSRYKQYCLKIRSQQGNSKVEKIFDPLYPKVPNTLGQLAIKTPFVKPSTINIV